MTDSDKRDALAALFNPKNVVLVGASDRPGHWSKRVWDNLHRFGYTGRILPVNPGRTEIWGAPCYAALSDLPKPPDHLAVFTPADVTIDVLRNGASLGARSATLFAAGFERLPATASGISPLQAVIEETKITVLGPNCMGFAGGPARCATIPDETLPLIAEGPIAIIAQSGAMCTSINRALNELQISASYIVSCGVQAGLTFGDFIDYLADDPALKVILCYIESIKNPARFLDAARRARRNGKSVVVVKIGGSESARQAALAHTGTLAGNSKVFEAYAAAAGIFVAPSLEDAIEVAEVLGRCPPPRGTRIAAVTNSGAMRSLITEAAGRMSLPLAVYSDETREGLRTILRQPDIENPLDTKKTLATSDYVGCIKTLLDAPEIDVVLSVEEFPKDDSIVRRVENLTALNALAERAEASGKTLAIVTPLLTGMTAFDRTLRARLSRIPLLREAGKALRVVQILAQNANQALPATAFYADIARSARTQAIRERAMRLTAPAALNEIESKTLLRLYGIPICPEEMVSDADEAARAARATGYPVVVKGVSGAASHKSELGLVTLGIADEAQLRASVARTSANAAAASIALDGYIVAKQITGGTETVLGVQRDREMGMAVMFGLGGVWVELFDDVAFAPANLDFDRAMATIRSTRAYRLLAGYRGRPAADVIALAQTLVGLGRLASDLADVIEAVDINPFVVGPDGGVALDALVVLRPPDRLRDQAAF
jgi:acyl-CoA synthetase (NDP forming)